MMTDPIITLHRYYIWANQFRHSLDQTFDLILKKHDIDIRTAKGAEAYKKQTPQDFEKRLGPNSPDFMFVFMYMSLWYASLYVVIEGWRKLKLRDPAITKLLRSKRKVDLLRDYRNSMLHFSETYYDERVQNFWEDRETPLWVRSLNKEFGRWFLTWFDERKKLSKS